MILFILEYIVTFSVKKVIKKAIMSKGLKKFAFWKKNYLDCSFYNFES